MEEQIDTEEPRKLITLFSQTDTFGTIQFVNEAFCEVSQFSKEELLGHQHNIIRHPDMPKQLFKIMWKNINDGKIFRGIIKNRAKDGSPYWVMATIMPLTDNNTHEPKIIAVRHLFQDSDKAQELYDQQMKSFEL